MLAIYHHPRVTASSLLIRYHLTPHVNGFFRARAYQNFPSIFEDLFFFSRILFVKEMNPKQFVKGDVKLLTFVDDRKFDRLRNIVDPHDTSFNESLT